MLNLLILIPVCLILAGCPSRRIHIASESPSFRDNRSQVFLRSRMRPVVLVEHLDEEHARIIRDLIRTVREERYRLNVDVLAFFAATVQFGQFVALRGDRYFTRFCTTLDSRDWRWHESPRSGMYGTQIEKL